MNADGTRAEALCLFHFSHELLFVHDESQMFAFAYRTLAVLGRDFKRQFSSFDSREYGGCAYGLSFLP